MRCHRSSDYNPTRGSVSQPQRICAYVFSLDKNWRLSVSLASSCPFCAILANADHEAIIAQNDLAILVRDGYPISNGHCLALSKRHVESFFETTSSEREAMFELVDKAKVINDAVYHPDSYNLGVNDGPAAGQTVPHVHIHVIPRYIGDSIDPRGGVRWVKPEKAVYWKDI